MNRRRFLSLSCAMGLAMAGPAWADYVGQVRAQLQAQGYRRITVTTTMLGRSHILAHGRGGVREIILNPRTGEILRDTWTSSAGKDGPVIAGSYDDDGSDDDGSDDGSGGDDDGGSDDGGSDDGGDDGGSDDGGGDDGGSDNGGSDGGGKGRGRGGDGDSGSDDD